VKINSSLPSISTTAGPGASRASAPQRASGTPAADRVDISVASTRLQEASAGSPPIDAQRIAEIKQAISEGRFKINPERIAEGLLASVSEMLGRAGKAA
jgi:negative regulator of flagellin synthesis FlgM